jgi:hypothetical protein
MTDTKTTLPSRAVDRAVGRSRFRPTCRLLASCALLFAAASCTASCGGGCTITLSGALAGTGACTAVGAYSASSNTLDFVIASTDQPTAFHNLTFGLQLPGHTLQAGTFTSSNSTTADTLLFATDLRQFWLQSFNRGFTDQGTFTITIASTGNEVDNGGDKTWPRAHGSLTATLTPSPRSTASGTVNVSVTF